MKKPPSEPRRQRWRGADGSARASTSSMVERASEALDNGPSQRALHSCISAFSATALRRSPRERVRAGLLRPPQWVGSPARPIFGRLAILPPRSVGSSVGQFAHAISPHLASPMRPATLPTPRQRPQQNAEIVCGKAAWRPPNMLRLWKGRYPRPASNANARNGRYWH